MASRYWVGSSGTWDSTTTTNWSATSGGAGGASAPTSADNVFFDINSGTSATVTVAGSAAALGVTVDKSDINLSLSGSPTFSGNFTFTSGSLTLGTNNLTVVRFLTQNTNARTISFGTGKITVTGNSVAVIQWQGSNLTVTGSKNIYATYSGATGTRSFTILNTDATESNVPNIYVTAGTDIVASIAQVGTLNFTGFKGTYASGTTKRIYGDLIFDPGMTITGSANNHLFSKTNGTAKIKTSGLTLDFPLTFGGSSASGGVYEFEDGLTQGSTRNFIITYDASVKLKAGVTSTVGIFSTGTYTEIKNLTSTVPGTQATLSQTSGTVNAEYINIKDINATGGATWNALSDAINKGNNAGWYFSHQMGNFTPIFGW